MEEKIVVPYAPILVESTRSIGYSFEAAVADIIDNSISAGATEIRVAFWSKDNQYLCVEDNGIGMTAEKLESAMRYGSQSSQDVRAQNDLGRFGLGLKMASLSQCRKVTVLTKKDGVLSAACWDLDYIIEKDNWALKTYSDDELNEIPGYLYLSDKESGTVVVWQEFDRLQQAAKDTQKAFDEKLDDTRKHIALVFHRFINDENPKNRITIYFNGEEVEGADPFLTKHPATQPLSEQLLRINGEEIRVKPYVLPFASKLSVKDIQSLGGKDDLRQKQGFYIYRNRRLIIWGTWFRLIRQQELGKLARVRVDIPNSLDAMWDIDIKKSTASLPAFVRKDLAAIVENTVGRSERVYRYRGRNVQTDTLEHLWNPIDERGKFQYRINREFAMLKILEQHLDEEGLSLFDSFIKILEDTFPYSDVYYRLAKNDVNVTESALPDEEVFSVANQMVQELKEIGGDIQTFIQNMDKMDFFVKYPDVVRKIKEVYSDE